MSSSNTLQRINTFLQKPTLVANSVKVAKVANLLKSVPVIGCGSTALYIIAFALSSIEDSDITGKSLIELSSKIVLNFLVFINVICRSKVIILQMLGCMMASVAVTEQSREMSVIQSKLTTDPTYHQMFYLNKFLSIDLDSFTQSLLEFSDLVASNIPASKGTFVSGMKALVSSTSKSFFSEEIISAINQKLLLFNSQISIASTQFMLLLGEIQSEQHSNISYKKFLKDLYLSQEYDKIYRKDLPASEIEMDIEKLSEEMMKSDSFKRLPVIQKISAPGFSGPIEESPFCKRLTTEFGGVKRNKSKKFISRKSNYRSSKTHRRVKKRSS